MMERLTSELMISWERLGLSHWKKQTIIFLRTCWVNTTKMIASTKPWAEFPMPCMNQVINVSALYIILKLRSCLDVCVYLKVTIICRYIFLRFGLETPFASTKFCDLNAEMVQGRQILMFYTTIVHIANDCGYKILRFWANPQKYQTLVPAKNSHLKVGSTCTCSSSSKFKAHVIVSVWAWFGWQWDSTCTGPKVYFVAYC